MKNTTGPRDWESWIDQQIREAQERGEFDNLPGKGQRLDLTDPLAADPEDLADLGEGVDLARTDPEPHPEDLLLPGSQHL